MSELPKGWVECNLEDVCKFNLRHPKNSDRNIEVTFVPMPALSEHSGKITKSIAKLLDDVWKGYTHFQEGDVLFAKITPCMENGKSAVAKNLSNGFGCGSTEFHVLRPEHSIDSSYVWLFLRQERFRKDAEQSMTGAVGQRRVPLTYLKSHPIPLPPANEQRRIVEKVESLLDRSARARDQLAPIPRLVERYRQAVLAKAFSGELTADLHLESPQYDSSFKKKEISSVIQDIRYGTSKKCYTDELGTAVLRIPNIKNGLIDTDKLKYTEMDSVELDKLSLRSGDILIIRSNGSPDIVGRSAIVEEKHNNFSYAGYLIRIRLIKSLALPMYIQRYLESDCARRELRLMAKSVNGIHNINAKQIRTLELPIPPLEEQKEIVRRIQSAFTWIDRIAAEQTNAAKLLGKLDQAVLAKAFRGELVPQDPNDEPASVLLDRIRQERAAAPKAKRQTRRKAKVTPE